MSDPKNVNLESKEILSILREIKKSPELTQRELSSILGISLGKVNFLLKALIDKGHIKVDNFKKSNNKSAYLYYLTPKGVEEKARITYRFLHRKMREYEDLEQEIRRLKYEVSEAPAQRDVRDGSRAND
jgi:EPS-associated MarR family transcriptional regulator